MNIKSKNAFVLIACLATLMAKAQDTAEVWCLETDTEVSIPVKDVSFLMASDNAPYFFVVTADDLYPGVTRATFAKRNVSAIDKVASEQLTVTPTIVNSTLYISGCGKGESIAVVSLSGQTCLVTVAVDGNATLDVSGLSSGTYILRVGDRSVKFIKR